MRTFVISCILIFLTIPCPAQQLPYDPRYRVAYVEALLEEIHILPEEERFLYLSYTNMVNNHYRRVVEDMIVTKGVLQRMESEGVTNDDQSYRKKVEKLESYKLILRKQTTRFLGYQELEMKIGRQALEEISAEKIPETLQWDYYKALTFWKRLEQLKKMPEDEMFLYLRDNSGVDRSFHLLLEELGRYKKDLEKFQASGTDENDEHYRLTKERLKNVTAAIRLEAERVMKGYAFHAMILDSSWRKAAEQLKDKDLKTAPEI